MKRKTALLSPVIAAITILSACSDAAPSASALNMDGKIYLSTDVQGVVLVPETRIQLTFTDGNLNAHGGCNSMGGPYTIDGDRLKATQLAMTEMACDEPRMQQDDWLARLLGDVAISLDGDTLTLSDGTITLTLLDREVATPDQPIENTHWVLDSILAGDAVSSVPAGVTASIRIVDGRVDVEAGCNSGGGTVAVTAETLTFGPIGLTEIACEAGAMAVERAVMEVLVRPVVYTINADVLTLDAGGPGLTFRAAPQAGRTGIA